MECLKNIVKKIIMVFFLIYGYNNLVMPINIYILDKVNEPMGYLLLISIFWGINYLIKYSAVLKGYATK